MRRLLRLMTLFLLLSPPMARAQDEQRDLARIQTYLNALPPLTARFLQIGPDGQPSEGRLWIQRPGRMRFQYDPPSPLLLVANQGVVVFRDRQLDQTSTIPLRSTPLGLLLGDSIRLSGDVSVIRYAHPPGQIQIDVVRSARPDEGHLALFFVDRPLTLRGWTVMDAQQQETRVSLFDVTPSGPFNPALFTAPDPGASGTP